jgi:hypothetical protein
MHFSASIVGSSTSSSLQASIRWLGIRLAGYLVAVCAATIFAMIALGVFGLPQNVAVGNEDVPRQDAPKVKTAPVPMLELQPVPVDDAMLVASGIGRGKFTVLSVAGSDVVDGAGKHIGQLKEVVIGEHDHVVGIVVRRSSGWLSVSKDIVVPSSAYRFSSDGRFTSAVRGKSPRDVATIELTTSQIDTLPSIESASR